MSNNIEERKERYTRPLAEELSLTNQQSLLASLSIVGDFEEFEEGEEL